MANNSVLIVEDTPVNLKVMRVLLTRQGFARGGVVAVQDLRVNQELRVFLHVGKGQAGDDAVEEAGLVLHAFVAT